LNKFSNIKERVLEILAKQLPEHLKYHSVSHTLYVLDKCILISKKENLSRSNTNLLKIAALYHDIGFIKGSKNHEEESCKIAKRHLKKDGYSKEDIAKICGMIMATKIPQQPKNAMENILADADLEYLGTKDFWNIGDLLFEELSYQDKKMTKQKWNNIQISFLGLHRYHTKFCQQYREKYKRKHLQKLKTMV